MILIDKLCYNSRLRYVNAGVKLIYTILTLMLCIISHSILIACIVLAANTFCAFTKEDPVLPLFSPDEDPPCIPAVFHPCYFGKYQQNTVGCIRHFNRQLLYHRKLPGTFPWNTVDSHRTCQRILSVFSFSEYTNDRYSE